MLKDLLMHVRVSLALTIVTAGVVLYLLGVDAVIALVILTLIEVTFSFENAIINAKILGTLNKFWRRIFLTVGIVIAVIGMRLIFPVILIMLTAGLSFGTTVDLALNQPHLYAERVEAAHPAISAFGGTFLLMLAIVFFMIDNKRVWLAIEKPFRRFKSIGAPIIVGIIVLAGITLAVPHAEKEVVGVWGGIALVTFLAIRFLTSMLPKLLGQSSSKKQVHGVTAFFTFVYLEVLDASFSLDGVLGAFAVTNDVLLIAAGLGIGAFWVRSLTIYMVKRRTLNGFAFIEHGAHYAILALAISLYASLFIHVPSALVGVTGLLIIAASIIASLFTARRRRK